MPLYSKVGVSGKAIGTTDITPVYGQSPTAGNLLLMAVYARSSAVGATTFTTPSGWTAGPSGSVSKTLTSTVAVALYYKQAAGGDANPTVTLGGVAANNTIAIIEEFTGVSTTLHVSAAAVTKAGALATEALTDSATTTTAPALGWHAMGWTTNNASTVLTWSGTGVSADDSQIATSTNFLYTATEDASATGARGATGTSVVTGGLNNSMVLAGMYFLVSIPQTVALDTPSSTSNHLDETGSQVDVVTQLVVAQTVVLDPPNATTIFAPQVDVFGTRSYYATRVGATPSSAQYGWQAAPASQATPVTGGGGLNGMTILGAPTPDAVLVAQDAANAKWTPFSELLAKYKVTYTTPGTGGGGGGGGGLGSDPLPSYAPVGMTGPFDATLGIFNWKLGNTARHRQGIVDSATKPVHMVTIGDSVPDGATSLDDVGVTFTFDRQHAFPIMARDKLAALAGLTVCGTGLVRARDVVNTFDSRWTEGGWQSGPTYTHNNNLGGAANFSPDKPGTKAAVWVLDNGNFAIKVDGTTVQSVTGGTTNLIKRYDNAVSSGTHTIGVQGTNGTATRLVGASEHGSTGILMHNVAQGGTKAGSSGTVSWSDIATFDTPASIFLSRLSTMYGDTAPSLVIIFLGGNDFGGGADTVSNIIANLTTIINRITPTSDVLLCNIYQGSSKFTTRDYTPWWTAMYQLAHDLDIPLWDTQAFSGGYYTMQGQGYMGDNWGHLNTAGAAYFGNCLGTILSK